MFSNIEIRKNRKLTDYLKVIFKPKMYKKYLLITEHNLITINQEELDDLYNSLVTSIPVKITGKNSTELDRYIFGCIQNSQILHIVQNKIAHCNLVKSKYSFLELLYRKNEYFRFLFEKIRKFQTFFHLISENIVCDFFKFIQNYNITVIFTKLIKK